MHIKLTTLAATVALAVVPASGLAAKPTTPGPAAHPSPPAGAKAYGTYCKNESKKHVAGQPGTPFSRCVKAMAKAASGKGSNPTSACKGLSKKHVKGEKGTAYSRCVKAAAKLLHDQDPTDADPAPATDPAPTTDPAPASDPAPAQPTA